MSLDTVSLNKIRRNSGKNKSSPFLWCDADWHTLPSNVKGDTQRSRWSHNRACTREVLGRTNRLLSFRVTQTDTRCLATLRGIHREQGDLIIGPVHEKFWEELKAYICFILHRNLRGTQRESWSHTPKRLGEYTDRQQDDLISLLLFLQNVRLFPNVWMSPKQRRLFQSVKPSWIFERSVVVWKWVLVGEKLLLFWPPNDRHSLITLTLRRSGGGRRGVREGGRKLTKFREKRMKEGGKSRK
jgi:sarcosine oxidase delta subunit